MLKYAINGCLLLATFLCGCSQTIKSNYAKAEKGSAPSQDQSGTEINRIDANTSTFYVAPSGNDSNPGTREKPFQTVEAVQKHIRSLTSAMKKNIEVVLRGGVYPIKAPITFSNEDSGKNGHRVIYRAEKGEKPELTGFFSLEGWKNIAGTNLYSAPANGHRFRQVFIDGKKAIRARWPKHGGLLPGLVQAGGMRFRVREDDGFNMLKWLQVVPKWGQEAVEIVLPNDYRKSILPLRGIDPQRISDTTVDIFPPWPAGLLEFCAHVNNPSIYDCKLIDDKGTAVVGSTASSGYRNQQEFYFVGSSHFVSAPGEWVLLPDVNAVLMMAPPGVTTEEDMNKLRVVAPLGKSRGENELLVQLRGEKDSPVSNISFEGITFSGTNFGAVYEDGFVGVSTDVFWEFENTSLGQRKLKSKFVPAAITLDNAASVSFDSCEFQGLAGGGVAINASEQISFSNNAFTSIGGTALVSISSNNIVFSSNLLRGIGFEVSGDGISMYATNAAKVVQNEIRETAGSAIFVSGWGPLANVEISRNIISQATLEMYDMGAVYVNAMASPSSVDISFNEIRDVGRPIWKSSTDFPWGSSGVYLDEGATGVKVQNNRIIRTPHAIFLHCETGNSIQSNQIVSNPEPVLGLWNTNFAVSATGCGSPQNTKNSVANEASLQAVNHSNIQTATAPGKIGLDPAGEVRWKVYREIPRMDY